MNFLQRRQPVALEPAIEAARVQLQGAFFVSEKWRMCLDGYEIEADRWGWHVWGSLAGHRTLVTGERPIDVWSNLSDAERAKRHALAALAAFQQLRDAGLGPKIK